MESKQKSIVFRTDQQYLEKIDKLSAKLKVDRSKAIRASVDLAISKFVEPGFEGDLVVLYPEHFRSIINSYEIQLQALESENKRLNHGLNTLCADSENKDIFDASMESYDRSQKNLKDWREEQRGKNSKKD